jgi:hypothetical protein
MEGEPGTDGDVTPCGASRAIAVRWADAMQQAKGEMICASLLFFDDRCGEVILPLPDQALERAENQSCGEGAPLETETL